MSKEVASAFEWKDPCKLGNTTFALLVALAVIEAVHAVVNVVAAVVFNTHVDSVTMGGWMMLSGVVALIGDCLFVVTGAVFIFLWKRLRDNLPSLGAGGKMQESWWSIGGFLIPVANLFMPLVTAQLIFKTSDLHDLSSEGWKQAKNSILIVCWWVFWLLSNSATLVGNLIVNWSLRDSHHLDMGNVSRAFIIQAVCVLTAVGAAVLAALVVKKLTKRQFEKHQALTNSVQPA